MCPLCIGTAAWLIAGGVSSAGGVATVAWHSVTKQRRRDGAEKLTTVVRASRQVKPRRVKAPNDSGV